MSGLDKINSYYRSEAIKTLLRNYPPMLADVLHDNGEGIKLDATVENLDLDEPFETLLRVAWDIWNGTGETEFDQVLEALTMEDFMAFLDSMKKYAELRQKIHSAYASGAEND
jgi:hypothetical protein